MTFFLLESYVKWLTSTPISIGDVTDQPFAVLEVRLRNAWVLYKITHLQNLFLRIQFKFETYVETYVKPKQRKIDRKSVICLSLV